MNTSGHGNEALIILVPVGVAVIVAVILFGGPMDALVAIDALVRQVVYAATNTISALF